MNPFDAVGTARISSAIYDRICRVAMGYQPEDEEQAIVLREAPGGDPVLAARAVRVVRATRSHPDVRIGASIRGAIDLVLIAGRLAQLRGVGPSDADVGIDAALTALAGRIRPHEGADADAEDIIRKLWAQAARDADADREDASRSGKG
jgi:MoxR-like ATPase